MRADDSDIDELLGETIAKVGESKAVVEASSRLQAMLDAARGAPKTIFDPRSLAVRFTRLHGFALSAAHYHWLCQREIDDSLALRMGSAFHAHLFENREVVCYDGRRQGKAWDRFEAYWHERNAVVLNEKEYALAMGMIASVRRHKRAMELLFDGTVRERKIDWRWGERECRSTPDALAPKRQVELKSARCTEPRWFTREALKRHYPAQMSFYDRAVEITTGHRPDENFVVACENVPPFNVTVLRLPDETRELGDKQCGLWFNALINAETTGYYGGYAEADIDLELPEFDHQPIEVELDGQLLTIG